MNPAALGKPGIENLVKMQRTQKVMNLFLGTNRKIKISILVLPGYFSIFIFRFFPCVLCGFARTILLHQESTAFIKNYKYL